MKLIIFYFIIFIHIIYVNSCISILIQNYKVLINLANFTILVQWILILKLDLKLKFRY